MEKEYLKNAISLKEIERSIQKTYKIETFAKMLKALDEYELIQEGDKIGIGLSGGKDSLLLAKMLQQLQKFSRVKFDLEFVAMDPGYLPKDRKKLEEICEYMGIPVKIFNTNIFEIVSDIAKESPCYLCARMRRGNLYAKVKELGCNKLALGHHFNDVIQTTLLNFIWGGSFRTMMPKLKSKNFEGLELIRPMYLIEEKDILRWMDNTGIIPMDEACPIVESGKESQRANMADVVNYLKTLNPVADKNIFNAADNVALGAILGYEKNGKKHSFLDEYGEI